MRFLSIQDLRLQDEVIFEYDSLTKLVRIQTLLETNWLIWDQLKNKKILLEQGLEDAI